MEMRVTLQITVLLLAGIFSLVVAYGTKLKAVLHAQHRDTYEDCLDVFKKHILPSNKFHSKSLYLIDESETYQFRLLELKNVLKHPNNKYVRNVTFLWNDHREVKAEVVPEGIITTNMFRSHSGTFKASTFFGVNDVDFNLCKASRQFSCSYDSNDNDWTYFKSILDTKLFGSYFEVLVLTYHDYNDAKYHLDIDRRVTNSDFIIKGSFPWNLDYNNARSYTHESDKQSVWVSATADCGYCKYFSLISNTEKGLEFSWQKEYFKWTANKKFPLVFIFYNNKTKQAGSNVPVDSHNLVEIHHVSESVRISDLIVGNRVAPKNVKNAYILYPSDRWSTRSTAATTPFG